MPEVLLKMLPVPLSKMVPVPTALNVPVLVAVKVNVSPLSPRASLITATRTSKLAACPGVAFPSVGICTKLPEVYVTQPVPLKYSRTCPISAVDPVRVASVPLLVAPRTSLTYCPSIPPTVNTAKGEASFTVTSFTVSGRSSSANGALMVGVTTAAVCSGTTGGVSTLLMELGADSSIAVLGSSTTNIVPLPLSKIVPVPLTAT